MLLKNKVILITGSTTGIGEGIARRCVAEGARVMIHGLEENRAIKICQELGDAAKYCICDLTKISSTQKLIKATVDAFGCIDGLVNNAAVCSRNNLDTLDEAFFDHVVAINMKAPLFLSQHAIAEFRRQKNGGVILNIGSINAYCGESILLVYSMTKGALMTMTRNLGDAHGKENIRVNLLNVGWTLTENENALKKAEGFPDDWEKTLSQVLAPSGRLLRPADIAPHAVFWLSDQSAPANAVIYELEQYPLIGRNLITEIQRHDTIRLARAVAD